MKLHNHGFTTSHIIGTTTFLFFFRSEAKRYAGADVKQRKRKGGLKVEQGLDIPPLPPVFVYCSDPFCVLTQLSTLFDLPGPVLYQECINIYKHLWTLACTHVHVRMAGIIFCAAISKY